MHAILRHLWRLCLWRVTWPLISTSRVPLKAPRLPQAVGPKWNCKCICACCHKNTFNMGPDVDSTKSKGILTEITAHSCYTRMTVLHSICSQQEQSWNFLITPWKWPSPQILTKGHRLTCCHWPNSFASLEFPSFYITCCWDPKELKFLSQAHDSPTRREHPILL